MSRTNRRAFFALALLAALLGGAFFLVPRQLFGDGVDYSGAASVRASPEFQDPALLEKAWALPVARLYRPGLEYQHNGSFCGPASVVNVLRSLGKAGEQATVLEGTETRAVGGLLPGGLSLDQLGALARQKLGGAVTVLRPGDRGSFRALLRRTNEPSVRVILNFHRGPLFGEGGGHHSPIAGYLADEDLALVLDVNPRFKPWLVKSDRLFEAMNTVDRGEGKLRGLVLFDGLAPPPPPARR